MTAQDSPLYPLLNEINAAANRGAPFLAIAMTVALPDICVSLISDDGRTNGERYKEWCRKNISDDFFCFVTPDDLWSMRCGVLHNGRFGDLKHNVARVVFSLPGNNTIVNGKFNDAWIYSVQEFCKKFTDAVFEWFEENRENENIRRHLPNLMQYRQGGFAPYVVGMTVLA